MKKIIPLLGLLLAAAACENTIPVEFGDSDPVIVINAQLFAQDGEQLIYLSESSRTRLQPLQDAEVTVEVDGKDPILAEGLPIDKNQDYYAAGYLFKADIPAGAQVKVSARKGNMEAWAQCEATQPVQISSVDTLRLAEQDFDSTYEVFVFKITFRDLPGTTYYRVGVRTEFNVHQEDAEGRTMDLPVRYEFPVQGKNDPALGGTTTAISIFDLQPTYLVFTDDLFRDQEYTLRISVPAEQLYPFYYAWEDDFQPVYGIISASYIPWLETISMEEYHYLGALNNLENFGYEAQMIVEPTTLPSNVYGGLGFVSVRNRSEAQPIKGTEKRYDYYYDEENGFYAE